MRGSISLAGVLAGLCSVVLGCGDDAATGGSGAGGQPQGGAPQAGAPQGGDAQGGAPQGGDAQGGEGGGSVLPTEWSCVGSVVYPPAPNPSVDIQLRFIHGPAELADPADLAPFADLTVDACDQADPSCAAPLDTSTTDANGTATVTLPTPGVGFQGFFEIGGTGVTPTRALFLPPIIDTSNPNVFPQFSFIITTPASLDAIATGAGTTIDSAKGHLAVLPFDCNENASAATSMTADGAEPTFYFQEAAPFIVTQPTTNAVFLNLDPGPVHIVATLSDVIVGETDAIIDAGTFSYVNVSPPPSR